MEWNGMTVRDRRSDAQDDVRDLRQRRHERMR
jgi:hypothetical protein